MKILLVNKFHYLKGGSERVYLETKKLLEQNGHEVICFSMKDKRNLPCEQERYFIENFDLTENKHWFKAFHYLYCRKAASQLEKLILAEKPDIAHLHNITHHLTPSILKPLKKHGIPIVHTLHDYSLICPNYRLFTQGKVCERCYKHKYYQAIFHKCARNSFLPSMLAALELKLQWLFKYYKEKVDLFISPSEFLKAKLAEWGVKQPIEVVNNFLEIEKFEPDYTPGDYIACASRLSNEKGVLTLVKSMEKLPDIKLKLIGDGPEKNKIENYIAKHKMRNIEMLGARFGDELFDLIKKSRFFVIPADWYENYPLFPIEAMALGKPVLAAQIGGLTEMVADGHNGWFYKPGDAKDLRDKINAHYSDMQEIVRLGQNARKSVEQKNCSRVYYDKLMKCYEGLLDKKMRMG